MAKKMNNAGTALGFEAQLWAAADKLRGNMEPSDYKHVALGLIFLKYISDAFEAKRAALLKEDLADAEDPEEYLAENVFWIPKAARWSHLQARAKQTTIGKDIDDAMLAIEARNASLKGVLPKDYARPALNKVMLGELIDLVSGIGMAEEADHSRDILGRVYEYFLGGFAGAEGKRGGEFYTPRSVVRLLVEMLQPYKGRVYDPCCGSGGMFVQSEKFVEEHGGRIGDIAIYGQESNYTTWRLAKMNLAVRGIDADIRWNNEGSFPSWFFSQWVHHHLEEFQAIAASKATTMGHIQRRHLKEAATICPPNEVLGLLGQCVGPLVEQSIKAELENRTLAETRDLLLPKLMSGELRLREAKQAREAVT